MTIRLVQFPQSLPVQMVTALLSVLWQRRLLPVLLVCLILSPTATQAQAATAITAGSHDISLSAIAADPANTSAPDWLEPRGISVVDLVGLVPEADLRDAIISSRVGLGIVQYVSGTRRGDTVTVNVRIQPRYWSDGNNWSTLFGCIGKPAIGDEWPVAVPPSSMRVYENGNEVTPQVIGSYDYVPAGQNWPESNTSGWWRYVYLWGQRTQFNDDGSVAVPANMGCGYQLPGRLTNLTATFVFSTPTYLTVEELGSETFTFRSYIGVGAAGHVAELNNQMNQRFGHRHDKFDLTIPESTDHAFVKFPPTSVEPYMGQPEINVFLQGSGTYRINGPGNTLSVDHVNSMALPIYGQWQDGDQSGGDFLNFFSTPTRLASPEYFVPTSVAYDPCMTNGGCSSDLLDQIYNAGMTMTIYYYRIARIREGLERVPLRQVGPDWSTVAAAEQPDQLAEDSAITEKVQLPQSAGGQAQLDQFIYLPLIFSSTPPPAELPDGDRSGCPCGWFDGYGRMFDFVPGP